MLCENKKSVISEGVPISRESITIAVAPKAREVMDEIRVQTGVPKAEALTRILEWYANLPTRIRLAILNRNESAKADLVHSTIQEMSTAGLPDNPLESAKDVTAEQATRIIKLMADRLAYLNKANLDAIEQLKKSEKRGKP